MTRTNFFRVLSVIAISIFSAITAQAASLSISQSKIIATEWKSSNLHKVHDYYYHTHKHHHKPKPVSCRTRHKQCIRRHGWDWYPYKRCMKRYWCKPRWKPTSCSTRHKQCIRRHGWHWQPYKRCMKRHWCKPRWKPRRRYYRHHHHHHDHYHNRRRHYW